MKGSKPDVSSSISNSNTNILSLSCAFKNGKYFMSNQTLTQYFNTHFPLSQSDSWIECNPPLTSNATSSSLKRIPSHVPTSSAVFAAVVRSGYYNRGRQVKVQACSDALTAINTTFQLAGK
jgi:hypothetical protein